MKKFRYISALLFWAVLLSPLLIRAQEGGQPGEWIRVQSENGEISIDFPAAYDFYGDKAGFSVSSESRSYFLTDMRMLNAYHEKTLLSLEVYKTNLPKGAADVLAESDERSGKRREIKVGKAKFSEVLIERENLYAVRRFFASENYVYILTAASRIGETPALKRFLDSLALKTNKATIEPTQAPEANVKTVLFSALKISQLEVEQNPDPPKKTGDPKAPSPKPAADENSLPLSVIVKPHPAYTEAARKAVETGVIRVRMTFSESGSITKINFLSVLKGGLVREVVFAAVRFKFLPAEKNGEPVTSVKTVEYGFSMY